MPNPSDLTSIRRTDYARCGSPLASIGEGGPLVCTVHGFDGCPSAPLRDPLVAILDRLDVLSQQVHDCHREVGAMHAQVADLAGKFAEYEPLLEMARKRADTGAGWRRANRKEQANG